VGPDGSEEVFGHTAFAAGTNPALPKDLEVESIESVPLTARQRERFLESWRETQELFERAPSEAVREADRLLAELLPDGATLSMPVEQRTLTGNDIVEALGMIKDVQRIARNARGAARGIALAKQHRDASTEDLTLAMDHYRVLFAKVLGDDRAPGL